MRWTNSRPSMTGIDMSVSTMSGGVRSMTSKASCPFSAKQAVIPTFSNNRAAKRRSIALSSTIRTVATMFPAHHQTAACRFRGRARRCGTQPAALVQSSMSPNGRQTGASEQRRLGPAGASQCSISRRKYRIR